MSWYFNNKYNTILFEQIDIDSSNIDKINSFIHSDESSNNSNNSNDSIASCNSEFALYKICLEESVKESMFKTLIKRMFCLY